MIKRWVMGMGMILLMAFPAIGADLSIEAGDEMGVEDRGTEESRSYSLKIFNDPSSEGVTGVRVSILEAPPEVTVVDGEVSIPSLEAAHYIIPQDTFTLSVKKGSWPPGQPMALKWQLIYEDSSGLQERMVVTVSTF